jgi:hypothetical protein
MIPVEMREKYLGVNRRAGRFLHQSLAKRPNAAAGIENHALIGAIANLKARSISAELQIFNLRRGGGTTYAPEFDPYLSAIHSECHLSANSFAVAFLDLEFEGGGIGFARGIGVIQRLFGVADLFKERCVLSVTL